MITFKNFPQLVKYCYTYFLRFRIHCVPKIFLKFGRILFKTFVSVPVFHILEYIACPQYFFRVFLFGRYSSKTSQLVKYFYTYFLRFGIHCVPKIFFQSFCVLGRILFKTYFFFYFFIWLNFFKYLFLYLFSTFWNTLRVHNSFSEFFFIWQNLVKNLFLYL